MLTIEESVRLVALQFRFTRFNLIPIAMRRLERPRRQNLKKYRTEGEVVFEPTDGVAVDRFTRDLSSSGFVLVDAFYERLAAREYSATQHRIRFIFTRDKFVDQSAPQRIFKDEVLFELHQICEGAAWRVRGWLNDFYDRDQIIEGQEALSLCFEGRQPLFDADGQPIMVWPNKSARKREGAEKVPLVPKLALCLTNGDLDIVANKA